MTWELSLLFHGPICLLASHSRPEQVLITQTSLIRIGLSKKRPKRPYEEHSPCTYLCTNKSAADEARCVPVNIFVFPKTNV